MKEGRLTKGGPSQVIEQFESEYWLDNTYIRTDLWTSVKGLDCSRYAYVSYTFMYRYTLLSVYVVAYLK